MPPRKRTIPTCHPARKHMAHGLCGSCYHLSKYPENWREWVKKNPTRASANWRKAHLKNRHGLTLSEYQEMAENQQSLCAICGIFKEKLLVDHDHSSGKIRGLLCHSCNVGLGQYEKMIKFPKLLEYLK